MSSSRETACGMGGAGCGGAYGSRVLMVTHESAAGQVVGEQAGPSVEAAQVQAHGGQQHRPDDTREGVHRQGWREPSEQYQQQTEEEEGGSSRGERGGARSRTCQDSQWLVVVVAVQLLLVLVVLHLLHPGGVGHHRWRQREHDRPVVMMEYHTTITTAQPVSHLVVRRPCLTVGGRPPPYPALTKTHVWGIVHAATHRLGRLRSSCPTILATAASSTRRRFTPADRYRPWGGNIRGEEVQTGGQSGRVRRQPRNGSWRFEMKVYGMCNLNPNR